MFLGIGLSHQDVFVWVLFARDYVTSIPATTSHLPVQNVSYTAQQQPPVKKHSCKFVIVEKDSLRIQVLKSAQRMQNSISQDAMHW